MTPLWMRRCLARTLLGQRGPRLPPHRAPQPRALTFSAASPASRAQMRAAGKMSSLRSSRGSAGNGSSDQTQEWVALSSRSFQTVLRLLLAFIKLFLCIYTCTAESRPTPTFTLFGLSIYWIVFLILISFSNLFSITICPYSLLTITQYCGGRCCLTPQILQMTQMQDQLISVPRSQILFR